MSAAVWLCRHNFNEAPTAAKAVAPCRPVIYLRRAVARGLKRSTPRQWASNPFGRLTPAVAGILDLATHQTCGTPSRNGVGGLLPRLFTLTPVGWWRSTHSGSSPAINGAVIFCHVVCAVTRTFPLGSMVLFVARTFLTRGSSRRGTRPRRGVRPQLYFSVRLYRQVTSVSQPDAGHGPCGVSSWTCRNGRTRWGQSLWARSPQSPDRSRSAPHASWDYWS